MKLSRNLIIIIFSLFLVTVVSVGVGLVIYFNSYIVTYDLNGGEIDEAETRVWVGSEYRLPTPAKSGFAFSGWYLDESFFPSEGVWEIENDVTLKAKWELCDEHGFIYEKVQNGYAVEDYKGVIGNNIVFPLTYKGEPIVSVNKNAIEKISDHLENAPNGYVKIYLPSNVINQEELSTFGGLLACGYTAIDEKGLLLREDDDSVSVVGYDGGYIENIVIPYTYNNKPVTALGDYAFYGSIFSVKEEQSDFFRILIPECIKVVGKYTFGQCGKVKAVLYYIKDDKNRDIIDLSRLYDWWIGASVSEGNDELLDVITLVRPAFGWTEHSNANYYIRFDANGGELVQTVNNGTDENGEPIKVSVEIKDMKLKKNKAYELPIPTREGYAFLGWYYNDTFVSQNGSKWIYDTHIELTAKWIEK